MDIQDLKKLLEASNDRVSILSNKSVVLSYRINSRQFLQLVSEFLNDEQKMQLMQSNSITSSVKIGIMESISEENRVSILQDNKYGFKAGDIVNYCTMLSPDTLITYFRDNKEFFAREGILPYKITKQLDQTKQLEIATRLEETGLSVEEKRLILATLSPDTKLAVNREEISPECSSALDVKIYNEFRDEFFGFINVDLNANLEMYRNLDKLMIVNPIKYSEEERKKLKQLCEICPEMSIANGLQIGNSTGKEYETGEKWIESVLEQINPEWTDVQKIAFIDNAIGKRISYTPDFDTEVCNPSDARATWKIIDTGYGVCNGIATLEAYMLSRTNLKSEVEVVSSGKHSFLKLKNIELPTKDGGTVKGDTILDPTWNLSAHRYGAMPNNFCLSYSTIRAGDINDAGVDTRSHLNNEDLSSCTIELEEQALRDVFKSIGIAREDGSFPIKSFSEKSGMIDAQNISSSEKIRQQLKLVEKYCPEFATCQNSTTIILQAIALNQPNVKLDKCVLNRVYEKIDENRRPVLYVYVESPEVGRKFYYADKEKGEFIETPVKEFEEKFECYQMDMNRNNGKRPWETQNEQAINGEDLTRSSGKIEGSEGREM